MYHYIIRNISDPTDVISDTRDFCEFPPLDSPMNEDEQVTLLKSLGLNPNWYNIEFIKS